MVFLTFHLTNLRLSICCNLSWYLLYKDDIQSHVTITAMNAMKLAEWSACVCQTMYYLFIFQIWNLIFGECKKNLEKADPKSSSIFGLYGRLQINMSLSFELRLVSWSWNSCNSPPVKDSQSLWSHFTGHREYNRKQREAIAAFSEVDSMEAPGSTSEGQEEEAYEGFAITLSYLVNVFLFIIKVQNLSLPSCVPWLIQAWREYFPISWSIHSEEYMIQVQPPFWQVLAAVKSGSLSIVASALDSMLDLLAGSILWFTKWTMQHQNKYKYPIGTNHLQPVGIVVFAAIMATLGMDLFFLIICLLTLDISSLKWISLSIFQAVTKISQFNGVYFTVSLSLSHLLADFLFQDNFLSLSSFLIYLLLVSLSMFDQGYLCRDAGTAHCSTGAVWRWHRTQDE